MTPAEIAATLAPGRQLTFFRDGRKIAVWLFETRYSGWGVDSIAHPLDDPSAAESRAIVAPDGARWSRQRAVQAAAEAFGRAA